jgi:hypothetical protein
MVHATLSIEVIFERNCRTLRQESAEEFEEEEVVVV